MLKLSKDDIDQLATLIADRVAEKLRVHNPVLSRADAAKFLSVTTRMLDKLASNGELTRVKFGSKTVFQVSDLQELIARKSHESR